MPEYPILPRTFNPKTIANQYARVAWFYEVWSSLTEKKAVQRAFTLAQIKDGQAVLEVAVGTGSLLSKIVMRNLHGQNEGVDLSPAMLAHARQRLQKMPPATYQLLLGSAYALPYEDDSFDVLFNTYMLDLLPERDFLTILSEFRRVLKPAGKMILVTFSFGTHRYHRFWYWLAKIFPALLTNCRPVRISQVVHLVGFHNTYTEQISQNTLPSDLVITEK